jgi:NDMA-dependent alcohol dehydrogenase
MLTEAAVLWEAGNDWEVEEMELDDPKVGEVLVRLMASGMCHSDEHVRTGDSKTPLPIVAGHEGAGIVEAVGPGVTSLSPGDHVVSSFIPSCGRCPSCVSGRSNLCDLGQYLGRGTQLIDNGYRHHARGQGLHLFCWLGTFAHHTVSSEYSFIKIDPDIAFNRACLVACGVATGWGAAVNRADIRPGDNVAVIGVGGVGINAVQGARMQGAERIFAIDPVEFKRGQAKKLGATHTASSIEEAFELINTETRGRMCTSVITTLGVGRTELIMPTMSLVSKHGRLVIVNIYPHGDFDVKLNMNDLCLMEKEIVGSCFGSSNARVVVPKLLDLYRAGQLDLDTLATRTYPLSEINQGYQDLRDGLNLRGILEYA